MAVTFHDSFTGSWDYSYLAAHTAFDTTETVNTLTNGVYVATIAVSGTNNVLQCIRLLASTALTYSGITVSNTTTFSGGISSSQPYGSAACLGQTASPIPAEAQWIDSVSCNDTVERTITSRANEVPWYNYTNATLYEKLRSLYPEFNSFCISYASGSPSILVPNPYNAGVPSRQNFASGTSTIDVCLNAPGISGNLMSNLTCTGVPYDGNPEELIVSGQNWPSVYALAAYLLLSDWPHLGSITVDMYFNGTQSPNIAVDWSLQYDEYIEGLVKNADISIYAFCKVPGESIDYYIDYNQVTGLYGIKQSAFTDGYYCAWQAKAGSSDFIQTMYNTIANDALRGMPDPQRVIMYGVNKLPEDLWWFIQAEYYESEKKYTKLWTLREPREYTSLFPSHELHAVDDSDTPDGHITLEVVLHTGKSTHEGEDQDDDDESGGGGHSSDDEDEDGNYDDDLPDFTDYDPTGFPGDCVLTKLYSMPKATLANVGSQLWSQSYFNVLKIQSNPIENIVAVKWFPFNIHGTVDEIKVGDVPFGINTDVIPRVHKIEVGSYKYTGLNGRFNFLDNSPYTIAKLHLPYCGIYQIDASALFNATLSVVYYVDLTTGECLADVRIDGIPYLNCKGQMGVDIPLTGTDRVQQEMKALSAGIHTGAGVVGHALAGDVLGAAAGAATGALAIAGSDYTSQRCANPSGVAGSFQNHAVYIVFEHADSYKSKSYGKVKGYPCHLAKQLSDFADGEKATFIQIDTRTIINIPMTSEENAELEKLLTTGVYI